VVQIRFLWWGLIVLSAPEACRSVQRDECADSHRRSHGSMEGHAALLNSEPRSFSGLVLGTSSKRPLVGVSAYIEDLGVSQVSDSFGVFRFKQLPAGWHRVRLRGIGFEPLVDNVFVAAHSGTSAVYELSTPRAYRCQTVITS
jgi:hypothetical protein